MKKYITLLLLLAPIFTFSQTDGGDVSYVKTDKLVLNNLTELAPITAAKLLVDPNTGEVIGFTTTFGGVTTVNGESGAVVLDQDDVGDGIIYVRTENNYTDTEKTKLAGIEEGAEVNEVNSVNGQTGAVDLTIEDLQGDTLHLGEGVLLYEHSSGEAAFYDPTNGEKLVSDLLGGGGGSGASVLDLVGYQEGGISCYSDPSSASPNSYGVLYSISEAYGSRYSDSFLRGAYNQYDSASSSGSNAYVASSLNITTQQLPVFSIKFSLSGFISNADYFYGLIESATSTYQSNLNLIGLKHDKEDSNFYFCTANGSSGTVTNTGIALSSYQYNYKALILVVEVVSTSKVNFWLYDEDYTELATATHMTNIPTNTSKRFCIKSGLKTTSSSARSTIFYSAKILLKK